LTRVPLR